MKLENSYQEQEKLWILVKAYPQPSQKYQETVCCAAITESGRLLRLYPIRYRHLKKEQQFERFDLLELTLRKAFDDHDKRPESYKVDEDSIIILKKGKLANSVSKSSLWLPLVSDSLNSLKKEQKNSGKSIGIIKPDNNTLKFTAKPVEQENNETKEIINNAYNQASLFEKNLTPLERKALNLFFIIILIPQIIHTKCKFMTGKFRQPIETTKNNMEIRNQP
jgi:hypothetical protein